MSLSPDPEDSKVGSEIREASGPDADPDEVELDDDEEDDESTEAWVDPNTYPEDPDSAYRAP